MKPKVRPAHEDSRGIIAPQVALERFRLDRFEPGPVTARFVDRYWVVRWDLPAGVSHAQEVLAHPVANVVFGRNADVVEGVIRARATEVLEGRGVVLGAMFRPAGFAPFLDEPMRTITDVRQPVDAVFGAPGRRLVRAVRPALDEERLDDAIALVDGFFAGRAPAERQPCEAVSDAIERAAADPTIASVDSLAAQLGVGVRQLQRLFSDLVGVSPRWVIRRYRLYEAAERAARGEDVHWARLAADLGYSDQSHLTRDFTKAIGVPPDRYARAARGEPGP